MGQIIVSIRQQKSAKNRQGVVWVVTLLVLTATSRLVNAQSDDSDVDLFELNLEQLKVIKISSTTKTEIEVQQAPAIVTVLTRKDFDRYQWRSVAESLRLQPGVDVLYDSTLFNIGMRGIAGGYAAQGQSIKAMTDGQDMAFRPTATNFLGSEFIPEIAIDRVEVIRGPLAALYGADAFSGVVNVVPKTAAKMAPARHQYEFQQDVVAHNGELGRQTQLASWGQSDVLDFFAALSFTDNDRVGLALPVSSPRYEAFAQSGKLNSDDDEERTRSLYLSLTRQNQYGQWQLDYSYQYLRRGANFYPESEPLSNALVSFNNQMAKLRWRRSWSDTLQTNASLAINSGAPGNDTRLYDPFRFTVDYLYRDYAFVQYTSAFNCEYKQAHWNLIAGVDYSFDAEQLPTLLMFNKDGTRTERNADRELDVANVAAYVQLLAYPVTALQLMAGYRVDNHSLYGTQSSYRGGLVYRYSDTTTFKLLTGSAFKAPALMLMFGGEHPRLLGPAPNRALQPQKSVTIEANVNRQMGPALQTGLTLYRTAITDYAEYDTIAANPQARNRGEIIADGLELELHYKLEQPDIDAFLNTTWVGTEVSTDVPVGIDVTAQSRLYPQRSLGAGITFTTQALPLRWSLSVLAVGPRLADKSNLPFLPLNAQREYALPGYVIVDVAVIAEQWPLLNGKRTEWSLSIKNAANQDYVEPGFSGIDVPGVGRHWMLSVQQSF